MPWRAHVAAVVLFCTTFTLYLAFRQFGQEHFLPGGPATLDLSEGLLKIALWVAPCVVVVRLLGAPNYRDVWRRLGLVGSPLTGYGFGFIATLPMLAVVAARGRVEFDASDLTSSVLLGPFAEEVLFRGFLFAQLCTLARWSMPSAALASAAAFGLAHLGNSLSGAEVFATTTGGLLFAWVVYRWNSLWPAIGLHVAMNLSWAIAGVDRFTAAADASAITTTPLAVSLARLGTVVLAVALTLWRTGGTRSPRSV